MAFGHAFLAEQVMKERDSGSLPEDQILDVRYCDLVLDPVGTVERIGEWRGGLSFSSAEAKTAIGSVDRRERRRIATAPTSISFADTGLDLATERARHAEYQQRYDVPSEV